MFMSPPPHAVRRLLAELRTVTAGLPEPMSVRLAREYAADPFVILISCLMSLRSRDTVTYEVAKKLFNEARTPVELVHMPRQAVERIVYPLGFYRRKAAVIQEVSRQLIERFQGNVPHTEAELLSLPGVGRKTANLVLAEAFHIPAICVDTHVHRLANTLGLVHTKTPEQTERALQKLIPRTEWRNINRLLVTCGQHNCVVTPITPPSVPKQGRSQ